MTIQKLTLGEEGYYREHGIDYPGRVVATGIHQTFGPVDNIIVIRRFPKSPDEFAIRLVHDSNPGTGGRWIKAVDYREERKNKLEKEMAKLSEELKRLEE